MKFWEITLTMILINFFGMALINSELFQAMGMPNNEVIGMGIDDPNTAQNMAEMESKMGVDTGGSVESNNPADTLVSFISNLVANTKSSLINFFRGYIEWPAIIMGMFGVPRGIGLAFTGVYNIIMLIGAWQIITGRSFGAAE